MDQNANMLKDTCPRQQVHENSMLYIIYIYILYVYAAFGVNRSLDMHGAPWGLGA